MGTTDTSVVPTLVRKVKTAIAEARKFSEQQGVGLVGQRIVDMIERVVITAL